VPKRGLAVARFRYDSFVRPHGAQIRNGLNLVNRIGAVARMGVILVTTSTDEILGTLSLLYPMRTASEILDEYERMGVDAGTQKGSWDTEYQEYVPVFGWKSTNVLHVPSGYMEWRESLIPAVSNLDVDAIAAIIAAARESGQSVLFVENIVAHLVDRLAEYGSCRKNALNPKQRKSRAGTSKYARSAAKQAAIDARVRLFHRNADGTETPTNDAARESVARKASKGKA